MSATVLTVGLHGLKPYLIRVTAKKADRAPGLTISGLSENAAREARVRVRSALASVGVEGSEMTVDVTIEPAPSGPIDLAIAVSILVVLGKREPTDDAIFIGELDLAGNVRAEWD